MNKDQLHEINSSVTFSSWMNEYNNLVDYVKEIPIYPKIENSSGEPVDIPYVTSTSPGIVNIDGSTITLENPTGMFPAGCISVNPEQVITKFISSGEYTKDDGLPKVLIKNPENKLFWGSPEVALRNDIHQALDYERVVGTITLEQKQFKGEIFTLPEEAWTPYLAETEKETTVCLMLYLDGVLLYPKTKAHVDYGTEGTYDYEQINTEGTCKSIIPNFDIERNETITYVIIKFQDEDHKIKFGGQLIHQDYETLTEYTSPLYKTSLDEIIYQLPFSTYNLDTNSLFIYLHGVLLLKDVDYEEYTDDEKNNSYKIKLINKLKKSYENGVLTFNDNLFYFIYPFSFEENSNILLESKKLYKDYNGIDTFLLPEGLYYRKDEKNLFIYYDGILLINNTDYEEIDETHVKFKCYLDKGNYISFYVFPYERLKGKYQFHHASKNTYYGVGNQQLYGHVKLTDTVSDGIATTPRFVKLYTSDVISSITIDYNKKYIHRDGGYFQNGLIYTGAMVSSGDNEFTPLELITGDTVPAIKLNVDSGVLSFKGGYSSGATLSLYGVDYPTSSETNTDTGTWKLTCINKTGDDLYTRTTMYGTNENIDTDYCGDVYLHTYVDYIDSTGTKQTSDSVATVVTNKNINRFSSDIEQKLDDLISGHTQFFSANILNATIENGLNVGGITNLNNDVNIGGSAYFADDATFESDVLIKGKLDVTKDIHGYGNEILDGNLFVSGSGVIQKGLTVSNGANITGALNVTSNTSIGGDLGVDGNTIIKGTTTISKTLTTPEIHTNTVIASTGINTDVINAISNNGIQVNGDIYGNRKLVVTGATSLQGLAATSATFTSNVVIKGNEEISQDLTVNGNTYLKKTLTVTSSSVFNDVVKINDEATIKSLVVTNGATFSSNCTFNNKVTINELTVSSAINGNLNGVAARATGIETSTDIGSTDTPVYVKYNASKKCGIITSTGKKFSNYLPLAGGWMTGDLYALTPGEGDSSRRVATTEWVLKNSVPTGTIIWFSADSNPSGFLFCGGGTVSCSTYNKLFSILGTKYGGDGSSNFGLPNLTGRVAWGASSAGSYISAGLPNHNHYTVFLRDLCNGTFGNAILGDEEREGKQIAYTSYASESNSIYGASSTVQPPALTLRPFIKY